MQKVFKSSRRFRVANDGHFAYVFQTGATINWDGNVWFGMDPVIQFNRLIFIFVLKAAWSGAIAGAQ